MTTVTVTELRDSLPDTIDQVRFRGDRVLVCKHKREVAAMVSVEDVRLLEALEDLIDLRAALEALEDLKAGGKTVTVEDFRRELGV